MSPAGGLYLCGFGVSEREPLGRSLESSEREAPGNWLSAQPWALLPGAPAQLLQPPSYFFQPRADPPDPAGAKAGFSAGAAGTRAERGLRAGLLV